MLLIGADGGGTQTALALCDETGRVLATYTGPGVNYNAIGLAAARENLRAGVDTLLAKAGQSGFDRLCVGLSALDQPASGEETAAFAGDAFQAEKLLLLSDAYAALVGATGLAPGAMIISGTGSMGTALDENKNELVAGGFGYLLGDPGSGFDIGRRAFLAAAEEEEHGGKTLLWETVRGHFGVSSLREAIAVLYGPDFAPSFLAALAKKVDSAAENGDQKAKEILRTAGESLAKLAFSLFAQAGGPLPVYCYGSVITKSATVRRAFQEALSNKFARATVQNPRLSPEYGALLCAGFASGLEPEDLSLALYRNLQG